MITLEDYKTFKLYHHYNL